MTAVVNAWANWLAWVGVVAWLYWLTGRVQRLLDYAEQLLGSAQQLLAAVPGKSAPRTEAPEVREPWTPFRRLTVPDRPTPTPRTKPVAAVVDVDLDRLLDQNAQPAAAKSRPRGRHHR